MESIIKQQQLELARALAKALEQNHDEQAQMYLSQLTHSHDENLFLEMGKLTRKLHAALTDFTLDPRLFKLAEKEMPNTRERLNYIINSTEEATHKTLSFIDESMPLASFIADGADKLEQHWQIYNENTATSSQENELDKTVEEHLFLVKQNAQQIHHNLAKITLVQGFQDLTGQVLRQVISLVEEVEHNLVDLIKTSGQHQLDVETRDFQDDKDEAIKAGGPQITNHDKVNVVKNQDDVDDLLASFGF